MLKVYGFSRVNSVARGNTRDLRVLWALEEMQLPYEIVGMDHPAHDLNSERYRALNPFEQIPTIDDDGVVLSESAAIVIYLARKTGKLIPGDLAGEMQVVRWCLAAVNTVELPLMCLMFIDWFADKNAPNPVRERTMDWAKRQLGALERWLTNREYVATDTFTVADVLMSLVLSEGKRETLLEPYPNLCRYRDRCKSRPAWQRTIEAYRTRVEAA
ncbi:MAG: glutathione S-transferase family protein [Labilithrix sp.]|nr:glutathione S-transferase family protein [Labilithrix sp.]MCW5816949.1 glutathione S-transferase family protein [Labilithrix sp.]